jgi:hypothetical protein
MARLEDTLADLILGLSGVLVLSLFIGKSDCLMACGLSPEQSEWGYLHWDGDGEAIQPKKLWRLASPRLVVRPREES